MSLVSTWRGWYFVLDLINNSRSEKLHDTRRITGQDNLVESGNNPGDYVFTTTYFGHEKLPVELSAFCRSTYLSVGRKETTESDFDIQDVVV